MSRPLEWSEAIPFVTANVTNTAVNAGNSNKHVSPPNGKILPLFSPNGALVAAVVDQTTIVVRDSETFQIVSCLQITDTPSHIEFDPTGTCLTLPSWY